jgi:hypothetical protein
MASARLWRSAVSVDKRARQHPSTSAIFSREESQDAFEVAVSGLDIGQVMRCSIQEVTRKLLNQPVPLETVGKPALLKRLNCLEVIESPFGPNVLPMCSE